MKKLFACMLVVLIFSLSPVFAKEPPQKAKLPNGKEITVPDSAERKKWFFFNTTIFIVIRSNKQKTLVDEYPKNDDILLASGMMYVGRKKEERLAVFYPPNAHRDTNGRRARSFVEWKKDGKRWYGILFLENGNAIAGDDVEIEPVFQESILAGIRIFINYKGKRAGERYFVFDRQKN